ncbi:MAG: DesA family fatty acid desaturase [Gammaproteobacteria bacterium]
MTTGLLDLPVWALILTTLLFTHITIASVTIFLHRHQTHRALELHPVVSHFFRFWLWLTTGMVTREWVAIHRKHHANSDKPGDPHSPRVFGIRKVLWQGAELYRSSAADTALIEKYGQGTPNDALERALYSRYPILGIAIMLIVDVILFGALGLTVWAIQMIWIPFLAAGVINGLGHWWGYRNFECTDAATNLVPWGILIGGEELHNNHHAYPSSARLSNKRWEFDIGWFYIRSLAALKLAKVKKLAPRPFKRADKYQIDLDTVRAIVLNRWAVTADYFNQVIRPVLRDVQLDGNRQMRRLLKRERALMSDREQQTLEQLIAGYTNLKTVVEFRQRLQAIWNRHADDSDNTATPLQRLQTWCAEAEATGIKYLEEFSHQIRGYALTPSAPSPA